MDVASITIKDRHSIVSYRAFALVANSGDNSLSLLEFDNRGGDAIVATTTIRDVPSPFAVVTCFFGNSPGWLVTSPSDNSVSLVRASDGAVLRTIKVGLQPYSAVCEYPSRAYVSNLGDSTLSVLDLDSGTVTATMPGVPGSRGLRGITLPWYPGLKRAWVAGTDANVVTIVDLTTMNVLTRFPVRRPIATGGIIPNNIYAFVASGLDNSVTLFRPDTLQVAFTVSNVPNPQDFIQTYLPVPTGTDPRLMAPFWASTGAGNSVIRIGIVENLTYGSGFEVVRTEVIPGIPGAAGMATGYAQYSGLDYYPTISSYFAVVTSPDSNQLFVIRGRPDLPRAFGITNAASFSSAGVTNPPSGGLAPGSLAAAFGSTGVSQNFSATSLPLPISLGGVSLRVGGSLSLQNLQWVYSSTGSTLAPLLFVGPAQVNFQLPPEVTVANEVPAQLLRLDGITLLAAFRVVAAAAGIFTLASNGRGQAAVVNRDGTLNFGTNPAVRGSFISIYATGAGATTPPLLPGEAAPASGNPLVFTQVQPTVTIGGRPARVLFSGMAPGFVGLWQINVEVPQDVTPGATVPLQISAGGLASNMTSIAVQ